MIFPALPDAKASGLMRMRVRFVSAMGAAAYSSRLELDGREPEERLLVLRELRVERELLDEGALRVGSPSLASREEERLLRARLGGGFDELDEGSFARRLGRRSSGGAARRTGVSQ